MNSTTKLNTVLVATLITCVVTISIFVQHQNTRYLKHDIQQSMTSVLSTAHQSMRDWQQRSRAFIELVASQPALMQLTETLLQSPPSQPHLLASNTLGEIRRWIYPLYKSQYYQGFFVINKDYISIASARDTNVGTPNLLTAEPSALERAFNGETLFSAPIASDIALTDHNGQQRNGLANLFLLSPIYDSHGNVNAVLSLRINLLQTLYSVLSNIQLPEHAEMYLFDKQGYLLSPSQYRTQLIEQKQLRSDELSIFKIRSTLPTLSNGNTFSAQDAHLLSAMEGYQNYADQSVIGSWQWNPDLQMGLALELRQHEAFYTLHHIQLLTYGMLTLSVVLLIVLGHVAQRRSERLQQLVQNKTQLLSNEKTLLGCLIDNIPDAIYLTDHQGKVKLCNQTLCDLLQQPAAQIIEQNYVSLFQASPPLVDELSTFNTAEGIIKTQRWLTAPNQEAILFDITRLAVIDHDGNALGVLHIQHDITQKRRNEEQLVQAKNTAERADAAKSEFVANMSHELRTPLNAIIGMTELCLQTELNTKQQDYLEKVQTASNALLKIINDILDFSKIEAGKLEIESIPFYLDDILQDISQLFAWNMHQKGIELVLQIDPDMSMHWQGDPLRINQILINFCSNAFKFTEQGQVIVRVTQGAIENDTQRHWLRFAVQDSGIGLSETQRTSLFKAFSQADNSVTRKYGGTGLGLTICKQLAELMGGHIGVNSQPNHGSEFFIEIPLLPSPVDATQPILRAQDIHLDHILLIEDNETAADILVSLLQPYCAQITCSASAEEALVLLNKQHTFALLLVDILLPGRSGVDFVHLLQQQQLCLNTPILLMSAAATDIPQHILSLNNVKGLLEKPIRAATLQQTLLHVFATQEIPLTSTQSQSNSRWPDLSSLELQILLVEDNQINQMVASDMLERFGITPIIANNGQEALEAIQVMDFDLVLMDLQMPVLDGFQATQAIRQQLNKKQLPVIAMSASALSSDKEKCAIVGMNDHLAKPVKQQALLDVLRKWIGKLQSAS